MRAAIVRKWLAACKEFAIRDDMLVQIAERKKSRPIGKGDELWLRLTTAECLTEAEALTAWSQSTWKTYKCALVAMQWGKRLSDGSLAWTGPPDATFADFQQYRMRCRNKHNTTTTAAQQQVRWRLIPAANDSPVVFSDTQTGGNDDATNINTNPQTR